MYSRIFTTAIDIDIHNIIIWHPGLMFLKINELLPHADVISPFPGSARLWIHIVAHYWSLHHDKLLKKSLRPLATSPRTPLHTPISPFPPFLPNQPLHSLISHLLLILPAHQHWFHLPSYSTRDPYGVGSFNDTHTISTSNFLSIAGESHKYRHDSFYHKAKASLRPVRPSSPLALVTLISTATPNPSPSPPPPSFTSHSQRTLSKENWPPLFFFPF